MGLGGPMVLVGMAAGRPESRLGVRAAGVLLCARRACRVKERISLRGWEVGSRKHAPPSCVMAVTAAGILTEGAATV